MAHVGEPAAQPPPELISQATLVFIDVETTGLWPELGDRICEICLIRQEPKRRPREWSTLVDPKRSLSSGAFAVNGITPEMLAGAPEFHAVVDKVDAVFAGAVYVAHNAPFDLGFLRAEYARLDRVFPERPTIDTVALARRYFRFASNRLGALAREFGIADPDAHRALGDCRTTRKVLAAIIKKAFRGSDPAVEKLVSESQPSVPPGGGPAREALPPSLAEMIAAQREIEIVYVSAAGSTTTRLIRVKEATRVGGYVYLVADCSLRQEERSFRLDRIIDWKPRV
jgi:DNA polymerase III epsilon subunit family exonuclease